MSSTADILLGVVFGIAAILVLAVGVGLWIKSRQTLVEDIEQERFNRRLTLDEPWMREKLRDLLAHHGIEGNCDIRDGEVHRAGNPGQTDAMAAALITVYRTMMEKFENPNLGLYIIVAGQKPWPLPIDLDDLRCIAQMLEERK